VNGGFLPSSIFVLAAESFYRRFGQYRGKKEQDSPEEILGIPRPEKAGYAGGLNRIPPPALPNETFRERTCPPGPRKRQPDGLLPEKHARDGSRETRYEDYQRFPDPWRKSPEAVRAAVSVAGGGNIRKKTPSRKIRDGRESPLADHARQSPMQVPAPGPWSGRLNCPPRKTIHRFEIQQAMQRVLPQSRNLSSLSPIGR